MRAMMATRAGRTRLEFRLGGTGPAPHRLARVCAKVCVHHLAAAGAKVLSEVARRSIQDFVVVRRRPKMA